MSIDESLDRSAPRDQHRAAPSHESAVDVARYLLRTVAQADGRGREHPREGDRCERASALGLPARERRLLERAGRG